MLENDKKTNLNYQNTEKFYYAAISFNPINARRMPSERNFEKNVPKYHYHTIKALKILHRKSGQTHRTLNHLDQIPTVICMLISRMNVLRFSKNIGFY